MTALDLFGMEHADRRSIGSHEPAVGGSDEWLTPPHIIDALGAFDLDPCSPGDRRPWDTAAKHYGLEDDGLRHGKPAQSAGAPSVLVAYGQGTADVLATLPLPGTFAPLAMNR